MKCGLLGRTLGHSYSPEIHGLLADYSYSLFEVEPDELEAFLKKGDFHGLNVTIPYKKAVIPYLDALSPTAQSLGAVNTIVRRKDGTLIGHNTDYFGFQYMIHKSGLQLKGKKVLVLGSGGASSTVKAVLEALGAVAVIISRCGQNNYTNLHCHSDAAVIVNTTPVGMYPDNLCSPVDLDIFPNLEGVLDVIYNPARTKLLLDAQSRGVIAMNGLWMLVAQAKESAQWFTGDPIDDGRIEKIHGVLKKQMENIVLIGMPGCGKSTVGTELARRLNRRFVDADAAVAAQAGMSIPDLFAAEGEAGFRKRETQVLAQLGKESGTVISTGGGCVTIKDNLPLLRQNGTLIWLKRDISELATEGRPLSKAGSLDEMYHIRQPMYEAFSDASVFNTTPNEAVESILRIWEESL